METQLKELQDKHNHLVKQAATHERIIALLDKEKEKADAEKFVARTVGPYGKKKLVGFVKKSSKVRGSVVMSAPAWKIRQELIDKATAIIADLKVFSVDECATLPSEMA